jgi:hypothetical protein
MLRLFGLKGDILPPKLIGLGSIYSYFFFTKLSPSILRAFGEGAARATVV